MRPLHLWRWLSLLFAGLSALRTARTQVCRRRCRCCWSSSHQAPSNCPRYAVQVPVDGCGLPGVARHHLLFALLALRNQGRLDLPWAWLCVAGGCGRPEYACINPEIGMDRSAMDAHRVGAVCASRGSWCACLRARRLQADSGDLGACMSCCDAIENPPTVLEQQPENRYLAPPPNIQRQSP